MENTIGTPAAWAWLMAFHSLRHHVVIGATTMMATSVTLAAAGAMAVMLHGREYPGR